MAKLREFTVEGFRGLSNLEIRDLNQVNLIIGDNDCGKTSILEALQLLRNPGDVSNVFRVARARERGLAPSGISLYDNFICLFPRGRRPLSLGVSAVCDGHDVSCRVEGRQKRVVMDASELKRNARFRDRAFGNDFELSGELETDSFRGELRFSYGTMSEAVPFEINTFTHTSGAAAGSVIAQKVTYLSPHAHLSDSAANQVVRNEGYKQICLKLLQLFDPEIADLLVLDSPIAGRQVECIRHKTLGIMPLATYGDGVKKTLALANAIARTTGGILLIDEVETAIHEKYFGEVFSFLVKACKAFDVQAFLTVQSTEAIDKLLSTQRYEEQSAGDDISVIAVWRDGDGSYSRVLPGRVLAASQSGS